ncbi:MAG: ABC transporter substrate-binding protein [Inquilinus sp.]|nr:ABC transporter substrate-binding protein [Inquilinus sp.]
MNGLFARILSATAGLLLATAAQGQELVIGSKAEPTSLDPHFHSLVTNIAFSRHLFEPLVLQDATQQLRPALAESWRAVDDTTWEFKLRPGVTWHDGSPFTARDVLFTLGRAGEVPNSPSSFKSYTGPITAARAPDDLTVLLETAAPVPLLPNLLSLVMIVSEKHGANATTDDYNAGTAVVGTGPYRLVDWARAERLVLERNDSHWGEAPAFERVVYRPISNDAARVAALLAGDVDMIDVVPPADIAGLRANPDLTVAESVANRLLFLMFDSDREVSPMVTARDGAPIANPFLDARVRRAVDMAINRNAIVDRLFEGSALATGDLAPPGYFGTSPGVLEPTDFDLEGARALLAEAGHADGFKVTVNGTNDRYINDRQVVQALAQMLSRLGLEVEAETESRATYFGNANKLEYSLMLLSFSPNPEVLGMLEVLLHSYDRDAGLGTNNRGRYSNPEVDRMIVEARQTVDAAARERLEQQAAQLAVGEDKGLLPLYYQYNTWALRKGLAYEARTDEMTLAMGVRPAN